MSLAPPPIHLERSAAQKVEISCPLCSNYSVCLSIDQNYAAALEKTGWDYYRTEVNGIRLRSPIRRCSQAALRKYQPDFSGKEILEIGLSTEPAFPIRHIRENGIRYTGIDPRFLMNLGHLSYLPRRWYTKPYNIFVGRIYNPLAARLLTWLEKFKSGASAVFIQDRFPSPRLSGNNRFDAIFASNSMEHWHEDIGGSSDDHHWDANPDDVAESVRVYLKDIQRCYEILKPGGMAVINVPIFLHGNILFFRGYVNEIQAIFQSMPWSRLTFEEWRRDHTGLHAYMPDSMKTEWTTLYGAKPPENIWLLNIVAVK